MKLLEMVKDMKIKHIVSSPPEKKYGGGVGVEGGSFTWKIHGRGVFYMGSKTDYARREEKFHKWIF